VEFTPNWVAIHGYNQQAELLEQTSPLSHTTKRKRR
jgi:hypothetical protein